MIPNNQKPAIKCYAFWLIAGLVVTAGILHAIALSYVNDDAFITFRYARNFVHGLGLVYNAGERVEGYTNFLWLMLVAGGMKLGFDPVMFSVVLGIFFYGLQLLLYVFLSWKMFRNSGAFLLLPLTVIALAIHRDFNVYATSGLETSMFSFFVSCTFALLLTVDKRWKFILAGFCLTLAMMTRPDGVIFLAVSVFYVVLMTAPRFRNTLSLLLAPALIFLPYWFWRFSYFGYFYPNTFYAKSVDAVYYVAGIRYAVLYFKTYYVFGLLPLLALYILWKHVRKNAGKRVPSVRDLALVPTNSLARTSILCSLFILAYTYFIIRIGGDFMFARFFIPITPILYFFIESLIYYQTARSVAITLSVLVLVLTQFRADQFKYWNLVVPSRVVDECQLYTWDHLSRAKEGAEKLASYFKGFRVNIAFLGTFARTIYYLDPPVAIEAETGLTDAHIAHLPLTTRGRIGHEKAAPVAYLRSRHVNFIFDRGKNPSFDNISFDGFNGRIIVYDDSLMKNLQKFPQIHFTPFQAYLDCYIARFDTLSGQQVRSDLEQFKSYYFDYNADSSRLNLFLRKANPSLQRNLPGQ